MCVCVVIISMSPPSSAQRQVCQACYLVIENYLKGDSRKNENYLARSIDFFKKQVSCLQLVPV